MLESQAEPLGSAGRCCGAVPGGGSLLVRVLAPQPILKLHACLAQQVVGVLGLRAAANSGGLEG